MRQKNPVHALLLAVLLPIALAVLPAPGHAQASYRACWVPEVGALYVIGGAGLPEACLSSAHTEISWTDGQIAQGAITATELAADAVTTDKLAAGAVTADRIAAGAVGDAQLDANLLPARAAAHWEGGALTLQHNVTSVVQTGTGQVEVTLGTGMDAMSMMWIATTRATSGGASVIPTSATTVMVYTHNSSGLGNYQFYLVGF